MKLSTRLALAMVSLVLVTTAVLSFITYRSVTEAAIPRALDRLASHAALSATRLEAALNGARRDVLMIQSGVAVAQLAAGTTTMQPAEKQVRESIEFRFASILRAKPEYTQLRIIGAEEGGRELVRVDRSGPGGAPRAVPDAELIQVGARDYFKRTISLARPEAYMSEIGSEAGGSPDKATSVLVAMPLQTPDGRKFGISVIDFDLGSEFDRIRTEGVDEIQPYIVNRTGSYLVHPDRNRKFASEAGGERIQDDFPGIDRALKAGGALNRAILDHRNGTRFGVGWAPVGGGAGLTVLFAAQYSSLDPGVAAVNRSALIGGGLAVLLAILLALLLARSLSRPLVQITEAAKGLSHGELKELPAGGGAEIRILSETFAGMAAELKAKQAMLENTIASIGDPVIVADERGKIVVANAAARRLLEIDPGADPAKVVRKFSFFQPDGVTPLPLSSSALARALRGESVDDLEFIVKPEDPAVSAYIVANARPLRDENGTLRGAVTVFRDITEQRRAHQSLVESEQMAQAIVNTALDAFVQGDENGTILEWSPKAEAMFGWTRAEVLGLRTHDVLVPEHKRAENQKRGRQFLKEVDAGVPGWRFEAPRLHRDGSELLVEVSLTGRRRGSGYVINAFFRNVTGDRAVEEQLIQAQKMESVGQLTGGIAHDFNNMLTVITGTIEILAEGVRDRPDLARIVALISDAADRGAKLTANLLAFARKQPLRPTRTDVNALVSEAAGFLTQTLGRQIEIQTNLSDYLWPSYIDPGQLSSALVNLGINARDAMPDGGKLTFTTNNITLDRPASTARGVDHPGDYIVAEVTDTGTGIPDAIRDRIFEPFFSTKETGQGTGLGLSMVFGFAKQSGGTIEVRSEPGRGTSFRIYLPRAEEGGLQLPPAEHALSPGGAETILCVEDDASVRAYVIVQLKSLGYNVLVASNAAEALAIADSGAEFDLLFTDIVMPGKLNGRQLADAMVSRRPSLRVLFTSGYTYDALARHGKVSSDIRLLVKPYRRAELARMLRLCLDRSAPAISDPVPPPYSVLEERDRFLGTPPE
jgi:PAS domain S-box-containing protein